MAQRSLSLLTAAGSEGATVLTVLTVLSVLAVVTDSFCLTTILAGFPPSKPKNPLLSFSITSYSI